MAQFDALLAILEPYLKEDTKVVGSIPREHTY